MMPINAILNPTPLPFRARSQPGQVRQRHQLPRTGPILVLELAIVSLDAGPTQVVIVAELLGEPALAVTALASPSDGPEGIVGDFEGRVKTARARDPV